MMTDRDYIAEMGERIEAATTGSGWVAAIVAQKLHAQLLEEDSDLLDGWLHAVAPDVLRQAITLRVRSRNGAARRIARVREFADAAQDIEDAADEPEREAADQRLLSLFESIHTVDDKDTRKRAADMTGAEHRFVADSHTAKAQPHLMLAAFHRAVAKKVGKRLTSDVFTEAEYEQMYLSITGRAA